MDVLSYYCDRVPKEKREKAVLAVLAGIDHIAESSPSVAREIIRELQDQRRCLKMIASENYSSLAVQLAMGNWLTDKYAEGAVHHRFYAGCEHVDAIEDEAGFHLRALFEAEHVYVQPHSGSDANLIAFWALLTAKVQVPELEKMQGKTLQTLSQKEFEQIRQLMINQKMMAMSLNSGGHLTHGFRYNISSKFFKVCTYDVDPVTGLLDYDQIARQAKEERPFVLLAGYSAYPRLINFSIMRQIADDVGAFLFVDMAHFAGLVAGKVLTGEYNPIPYADIVTSTTHKTLRGPRGGVILCKNKLKEFVNKGCPLVQGGPLPHVIAAKAVAFQEARGVGFKDYARRIIENAQQLAISLKEKGATLITGGTDNHMVIVDVTSYGLTGKQAEEALRKCGITTNRNSIPFDKNGTWLTSGIRIGTPALTTLGMGKDEMEHIASFIVDCLSHAFAKIDASGEKSRSQCDVEPLIQEKISKEVQEMIGSFPLYPELLLPELEQEIKNE